MKKIFVIFLFFVFANTFLLAKEKITFTVLEFQRGFLESPDYSNLEKYLNDNLENFEVLVEILSLDEINTYIRQNRVDFLLTSPLHYVELKGKNLLSNTIATVAYDLDGKYTTNIGGVILTLSNNDKINTLQDLKDKTIGTLGKDYFAAYTAQLYELHQNKIKLNEANMRVFANNSEMFEALFNKQVDVIFARSGVFEKLMAKRGFDTKSLKIINEQKLFGYPYKTSTKLYPEWPVVTFPSASVEAIREITLLLYSIKSNDDVAKSINIGGFSPSADYTIMERLARDLRLPPFDTKKKITFIEIWENYYIWISIIVLFFIILIVLLGFISYINNNLKVSKLLYEEQRNRLDTLIEFMPDLVWMKDTNGIYLICNKRFEDFFGAPKSEIIGKSDYDFVEKDLADFFKDNDKHAMELMVPVTNYEEIVFAIDGHKEFLQTTKTAVKDAKGNIIGVLGIGRDVTLLKQQEQKLKDQKQELQEIFNTTKNGIAIIDRNTNFLKVNQAYCDITGLSEQELLRTSCQELTIQEDREKTTDIIQKVLNKHSVPSFEKRCMIKGKLVIVSMSLALMPNGKNILVSIKDISYLKAMEEQAKLASMGEMIGNIAHQWRQPLSIISVLASGLKLREDFGEIQGYSIKGDMDEVLNQTNYLSKTIDDFRNFIKDGSSQKIFSIQQLIDKTTSLVKSSFTNHHIKLDTTILSDSYVRGYENELIQCLINIINNAKDAIIENVPNDDDRLILINLLTVDNFIELSITDSGGGISKDIINRIFEPYFTTKHQSVGTGIGLSMVHQIITKRHSGKINVENVIFTHNNKTYEGAKFTILLPQEEEYYEQ